MSKKYSNNHQTNNGFVTRGDVLISYKGTDTHVVIPDGITEIRCTFSDNENLISVTMPESVKKIATGAFMYCRSLEHIKLPEGLEVIKERTFCECKNLREIKLPENLKTIEECAFFDCLSLTSIEWNEKLEKIKQHAFMLCRSLENVVLPKTISTIEKNAFRRCTSLKLVEHQEDPDVDLKIDKKAFTFRLGTYISESILTSCATKDFQDEYRQELAKKWDVLDESDKKLFYASMRKKSFREAIFKSSHEAITDCLQYSNLTKLRIEELDVYLDLSIQEENTAKTAVLLDYKNKQYCQEVLETRASMQEMMEIGLEAPSIAHLRKNWKLVVGADGITVTGYKGTEAEAILPAFTNKGKAITTVKKGDYSTLTKLIIEDGITLIDSYSLNSKNLVSVELPNSLIVINSYAFWRSSLEELYIPDSVKFVGDHIFYMSDIVKTVSISRSLANWVLTTTPHLDSQDEKRVIRKYLGLSCCTTLVIRD